MSAARTLTDFVRALRAADVGVSPAEAIDASRAMALVGFADRSALKTALRPVMAKSAAEAETFDRMFDLFFSRRDADEAETANAGVTAPEAGAAPPEDFMQLATSGDEAALSLAMERAGQGAGVQEIRFSTQTAWYAQQMLKQLGVEEMEAQLLERLQQRTPEAEAEAGEMIAARRDMLARARAHVEAQFEVFGAGATQQFREDVLATKPIGALDRADHERMKALVAKLAKKLATKHARRRRRQKTGQLDVRSTLRRNAGIGGVPFELSWKQVKKERAKIVCLTDVSGSVARHVRFLLLLAHSLRDVIPDFSALAFSARLADVTDWMDTAGFEGAMERILREIGMGSTDYGQALSDLKTQHWHLIDRRTTLIILGDGRSNHGDPRLDIFREMTARAKRTLWLSPESEPLWGTGDSELLRYRPYCSAMRHVASLRDLERVFDEVLASYG